MPPVISFIKTHHDGSVGTSCMMTVLVLVGFVGCRLVTRQDPVPKELAAARRLCNQGLCAVDEQDLPGAETLLSQAVDRCPTDIDARQHYANILWKRGLKVEAIEQITKALELSPEDVGLCLEAGRMYWNIGLLDDADQLSKKAIRNAPHSVEAWYLHGQVALARGHSEDALADFHRALSIAPDNREVLLDTAKVYQMLNRPRRALSTLAILGETYGPNQVPANVLVLEGASQEALNRPAEALVSYRRAREKGDLSPDTVQRIALLQKQNQ